MSSPNLLAGKAQAIRTNITRFTQLTTPSAQNQLEQGQYISHSTPAATKATVRFDKQFAMLFVCIDSDGCYLAVTLPRPTMVAPTLPPVIGISVSDELERIQPASIAGAFFEQSVITCVTKGDAERFSLPYVQPEQRDPVDVPPKKPDGAEEDLPAGLDRLNWIPVNDNPALVPVFAAIPMMLPIEHGTTWPWGQHVLEAIAPDAGIAGTGRMWADGMRYLYTNNNGFSFHATDTTFFEPSDILPNDQATDDVFRHVILSNHATTVTTALSPHSIVARELFHRAESTRDAHYLTLAPATPPPAPVDRQHPPTNNQGLDALAAAITNNRPAPSRRDQEEAKQVITSQTFYSIFAGEVVPAQPATGEPAKFVPAILRPEFIDNILEPTKPSDVMIKFKATCECHMAAFKCNPLAFPKGVDFNTDVVDSVFALALKKANFSKTPLGQDPAKRKTCLFGFSFLAVHENSQEFNAHQAMQLSTVMDDNIDQPSSLRTKKAAEMFIDGKQTSPKAVYNLCSTLACFLDMIRAEPERSFLWDLLQDTYNLLTSQDAETWFRQTLGTPSGLRLYHNLIMDITICLTYVVKFASDPAYQLAVQNKTAIDTKALEPTHAAFRTFKHRVQECMIRSDLGSSYDNHSNTIQYFPTLASTLSALGGTPAGLHGGAPPPPPPPPAAKRPAGSEAPLGDGTNKKSKASGARSGHAASSANNTDREAKAKAAGMLKLTAAAGTNRILPKPSHILHANKSVCMNFCTVSYACRNVGGGKTCHYLHPAKFDDIPAPIRESFAQWVTAQPNIEWVTGKGPAGTV